MSLWYFERKEKSMARIAAIQMTSTSDKSENLSVARTLLEEAAVRHGVNAVAFPENFGFLPRSDAETHEGAETVKGMIVETLQEWAAEWELWILGGSVLLRAPGGKVTNTSLLIDPSGGIVARYDKIHLF